MTFPNMRWKPEPEHMGAVPQERMEPATGASRKLMFAKISGGEFTAVMETGETHESRAKKK
ncbi:MAG: hypothetical protein AB1324_00355 [Candidatus Micrarchaeota archaeon]